MHPFPGKDARKLGRQPRSTGLPKNGRSQNNWLNNYPLTNTAKSIYESLLGEVLPVATIAFVSVSSGINDPLT